MPLYFQNESWYPDLVGDYHQREKIIQFYKFTSQRSGIKEFSILI